MLSIKYLLFALLVTVGSSMQIRETRTCFNKKSRCYLKKLKCPVECLSTAPKDPKAKVCYINCKSPNCNAKCKRLKQNFNSPGAVCFDPRFIGGDGIGFYFHGKHNEHFSLVSDVNFQINARFTGIRPAKRSRDNSWIQALGFLLNSNTFTLEAAGAANRDNAVGHLKFMYNEDDVIVPEGYLSRWESSDSEIIVERISDANSVLITISDFAEIFVSIVPETKQDRRIHKHQITKENCIAHLEVKFKFYGLSPNVEGVLGRTYQPGFRNEMKPGVAMPVVGGEVRYRTSSLLSPECSLCTYSQANGKNRDNVYSIVDHSTLESADGGSISSKEANTRPD